MQGNSKKQYLILLPCCLLAIIIFIALIVVVTLVSVFARKKVGEPPSVQFSGKGSTLENTKTILSFGTRVPGEAGWNNTRDFVKASLESYHFHVAEDTYVYNNVPTMPGAVTFVNVIGTRRLNLDSTKSPRTKFVLACHYDSKKFTNFKFLGAIDSVVPCSMLLSFAKSLDDNVGDFTPAGTLPFDDLVMIFFDGEEAFNTWSETDSRYGSRGLAQKWKDEDKLKDIQYFMLLDLIGAAKPTFYNYDTHFKSTAYSLFSRIVNLETELRNKNILKTKSRMFFDSQGGGPDDDHAPFMEKGVPIIHWIPTPFPAQWHNESDDFEHLDWDTINDLQTIFQWFMYRYLTNTLNK